MGGEVRQRKGALLQQDRKSSGREGAGAGLVKSFPQKIVQKREGSQ